MSSPPPRINYFHQLITHVAASRSHLHHFAAYFQLHSLPHPCSAAQGWQMPSAAFARGESSGPQGNHQRIFIHSQFSLSKGQDFGARCVDHIPCNIVMQLVLAAPTPQISVEEMKLLAELLLLFTLLPNTFYLQAHAATAAAGAYFKKTGCLHPKSFPCSLPVQEILFPCS